MRLGLWPGLLASMLHNMHRQQTKIQLFEMGVIFEKIDNEVIERPAIAGLLVGETGAMSWNEPTRSYDFYDMAGDLQSLIHSLFARNVTFVKDQHSALHPGKSARLCFEDKRMGWIGVLHPKIASALDVGSEVMVFELYIDALPTAMKVRYQAISKYPQIRRDLSLLVDEKATAHDIERVVRQALELNLLKDFSVFDVYTGAGIPAGKKSIAIALTLQNEHRTLTDSEINVAIDIIIAQLDKELSIKIRE
jgi:phenylalanyl-tRNA synthetase beta chain